MPSWISPADAQRLQRRQLDLVVLFRMQTGEGHFRLWSGHGDFIAPNDPIDPSGTPLYSGAGEILNLPELSQLINGATDRIDFSLSGVGETAAALADESAEDIEGAEVRVGIIVLDAGLQPVTDPRWLWCGEADVLKPEFNGQSDPQTYTLTLSAGTQSASRRRSAILYYSAAQQQQRSPGDKGCDRVTVFVTGHRLAWPVF